MKPTTLLLLLISVLFFACYQRQETIAPSAKSLLTDAEKRKVFTSIVDTLKVNSYSIIDSLFQNFYAEYYPENDGALENYNKKGEAIYYYSLNEDLISPRTIVSPRVWARCVIHWAWEEEAHIVEIEKTGDSYLVRNKFITKPDSFTFNDRFKDVFIITEDSIKLDPVKGSLFFSGIKSSGILNDTLKYPRAMVLDGSRYYFETIINCRYVKLCISDAYHAARHYNSVDENKFDRIMDAIDMLFYSTPMGKSYFKNYCIEHLGGLP
ncbi:MAG: hypothetical protein M0D57_13080 [Sphingobacteriales bacterium JAD_PAG50586_3]|nr:MAG: hypothetical protein M0D57_13080 [Sphingobacteriales bacterium JAD_PAG50586_3]